MKKYFLKILVLTLTMIGIIFVPTFASDISEQIENAMCVTEYPDDTEFDDFDTVTFGEYPQSEDGGVEPIEWFVLEKKGDKALLLSKYIIDQLDNSNFGAMSWKSSPCYAYLNYDFKSRAFNTNDIKHIIDYSNNGNIFVLSEMELKNFFKSYKKEGITYFISNAAKGVETSWWGEKDNYEVTQYCIRDIDNKTRSFYCVGYEEGSPGNLDPEYKQCLCFKGIDIDHWMPNGLRPAIWVSLSDNGNQNSRNTNNFATQQNNTGKDSNTIAGLPSVQSEYRNDGHFYLNNNMQKSSWVYYVTYYYHVDGAGNIEKSKWIEQRYVGADGRMYRGRQTPDGKWVGDDGLVVNVSQDLSNSLTIEVAEPDSWYKTQSGLWYYFENDRTTTKKGWFTDARDNQTYYLDPSTGIMAVGWTTINGSMYYFNESHDNVNNWYETGGGFYESYGKKTKAYGSMFKNEITPDGHQVDASGKLAN